jgi:hypothetical protein
MRPRRGTVPREKREYGDRECFDRRSHRLRTVNAGVSSWTLFPRQAGGNLSTREDERNALSAIEFGFPHDFDTSGLVYGTTAAQIDDHR